MIQRIIYLTVCLMMLWVMGFIMVNIGGCAGIPSVIQKTTIEGMKKKDMVIEVNGVTEEGVLIAKRADLYKVHAWSKGDLDIFYVTTCHREWAKEKAWNIQQKVKSGLFGWGSKTIDKKNEVVFDYKPTEMESSGYCPILLTGVSQSLQQVNGFIDFEDPELNMDATISCNGVDQKFNGVGACQARAGLYQKIDFGFTPYNYSPDVGCELGPLVKSKDKYTGQDKYSVEFEMPKGNCVYFFKDPSGTKKGRITLLGYDDINVGGSK